MEANRAIIKTLLYSDIFNFPLKKEEIWFYLISDKKISYSAFTKALARYHKFNKIDKYYFIFGKGRTVNERLAQEEHNKKQIAFARDILRPVARFPTVSLIGLSGSLALSASKKEDDIDIFIISKKSTAWFTRFIIVLYLILKRKYRWRYDRKTAGKFCLNMIVDEDFSFPKNRQDLYTAHEVAQMLPLFDKDNAYVNFLNNNKWLLSYLPNIDSKKKRSKLKTGSIGKITKFLIQLFFLEQTLRYLQTVHMGRVTNETIDRNILAFHPDDYRQKILTSYKNSQK